MVGVLIRSRGEPNTIILLKWHRSKWPSKLIPPYPQIRAALRPHQSSFFVQVQQLIRKFTIYQSAENKCQWSAQPQKEHLHHVSPPGTMDHCSYSCLQLIKPVNILTWKETWGVHEPLTNMDSRKERVFKGCDPWQVNKVPVNGPSPRIIWTAQAGLDVLFFEMSWRWGEGDVGEVRENNDQNTLNENAQGINEILKDLFFYSSNIEDSTLLTTDLRN